MTSFKTGSAQLSYGSEAVRAKLRQNGRLGGRRGETGSRNMAATQKKLKDSAGDFL